MVQFIFERSDAKTSPDSVSRSARIDSKGRISIPSDIRRSLGLETGRELVLDIDLEESVIVMRIDNGQSGVVDCIGDCGSPGPGSVEPFSAGKPAKAFAEIPLPRKEVGSEKPGSGPGTKTIREVIE